MARSRLPGANRRQALLLWLAGLGSALIYAAIFLRLPLLATVANAHHNLSVVPVAEWPLGVAIATCVVLLFLAYGIGGKAVQTSWRLRSTRLILLGFPVVCSGLLVFTFPITSTDVYDYLFRGWMLAHYQANPFVVTPDALPHDPLYGYVVWPQAVSAYGPLWERMGWALADVAAALPGGERPDILLLRLALDYKLLSLVAYGLCAIAISAAIGGPSERRWLGLYLWLWNPLVLWETIGAAHNDIWMVLPVVLALWNIRVYLEARADNAPQRSAPIFALVALTAGGLVKFVAFFFGPLALAAALRRTPGWRERVRLVIVAGLVCLVFVAFAYAPFWEGPATLQNVGARSGMYTATWLAALHPLIANSLGTAWANTIASQLGFALLLAGVAWATWRSWQKPEQLTWYVLGLILWFLLACNPWFQPWYVIWAVAIVVLLPNQRSLVRCVIVFCITAELSYVLNGLVLPALGLDQPPALRELLMSLFLYLPPLVPLVWQRFQRHQRARSLTLAHGSAIMRSTRPRSSVDRATVS